VGAGVGRTGVGASVGALVDVVDGIAAGSVLSPLQAVKPSRTSPASRTRRFMFPPYCQSGCAPSALENRQPVRVAWCNHYYCNIKPGGLLLFFMPPARN